MKYPLLVIYGIVLKRGLSNGQELRQLHPHTDQTTTHRLLHPTDELLAERNQKVSDTAQQVTTFEDGCLDKKGDRETMSEEQEKYIKAVMRRATTGIRIESLDLFLEVMSSIYEVTSSSVMVEFEAYMKEKCKE